MSAISVNHRLMKDPLGDLYGSHLTGCPSGTCRRKIPASFTLAVEFAVLILFLLLPALHARGAEVLYAYPFTDPYIATVIGTPKDLQAEVPENVPSSDEKLKVYESRRIPAILWYDKRLRYSVATQDKKAPLIFIIPGMGGAYNDHYAKFLQRVFYKAGFHVVSVPSPTHPNFVPAASSTGIPGNLREDAADMYRVMELIIRNIANDLKISGFDIIGYSLGAAQAAFIADLDRQRGQFRFDRVVLVNPPVNLYNATQILDAMIKKIPGGEEKFDQFFDQAFKGFVASYERNEPVQFAGDFLYRGRKPNDKNLEALIGLSFRLSLTNMVFTSDVFTNAGYIKPKSVELSTTDSLTSYFKIADRLRFADYFHDIFLPYFQEQKPGLTEQQMIDQLSLESIETFLRNSGYVYLFHNEDDILLRQGEIGYLRGVFGGRARIYPHGGHCGNLMYRENVEDILAVFKGETTGTEEMQPKAPAFAVESAEAATTSPPSEQIHEPPPILSEEANPVQNDTGEAALPPFSVPHPALVPVSKPGLSYVIDVYDPIETANRAMYRFNATFDEYVFLPVTRAYEFVLPVFVQNRISGVFSNISDIRNFSNALFQLRPGLTARIFTRFLINTTLGLGGMWDPATGFGFPRHEEDFGQTLGRYGAGPGPYIVLPILGPSGLRDTTGLAADTTSRYFYLMQPTDMDRNTEWEASYTGTNAVDTRHNISFRYYQTGSPFEYDLLRLLYTKKRELDIEQ
jgi:ABC-type transporter lipoprotein component MlaA/pimeloyl-ACP methyl ester carboxylesterase